MINFPPSSVAAEIRDNFTVCKNFAKTRLCGERREA
jgi:hypothetical protein